MSIQHLELNSNVRIQSIQEQKNPCFFLRLKH